MSDKQEYYNQIEYTNKSLKDFQVKTVDYVYEQLYVKGRKKMLIADEVGLGKTIVAKGIIAKSFKRYLDNYDTEKKVNPTFNIVYICSNLALANQNIRKLNFTGKDSCVEETINRLNYLAKKTKDQQQFFKINSLTPGTSFDERSSAGEAEERAIILALLADYDVFYTRWNGLRWMLKGSKSIDSWDKQIHDYYNNRYSYIKSDLFKKFRDELSVTIISKEKYPKVYTALNTSVEISFWKALQRLAELIDGKNEHLCDFKNEVIRGLRRILSYLCLEYLGADIFILDEFQRYSNLIKTDSTNDAAIELARKVFSIPNAKVLMLSATPFKPYTNDFDESTGEMHYTEFRTVLRFLMDDEADSFWKEYEQDRKKLFNILRHSEEMESTFSEAVSIKVKLEKFYRKSIVRTERFMASENKDAMIKHIDAGISLKLQVEDIHDFVILDRITQHLNKHHKGSLMVPLEYVKSCPYALSFLDSYQHKEKLRKFFSEDVELQKILKESSHAWLDITRIDNYLPLIPLRGNVLPNAKLRLLIEKTVNGKVSNEPSPEKVYEGWKYLWIPPSLPYYELSGPFLNSWGFSKTLIFSSWKMVPRMVAGLVSYEAERLSVGNKNTISQRGDVEEKQQYFLKPRLPRPQFTFKNSRSEDTPEQMNNYILLYPSLYLANIYNPVANVAEKRSLKEIRRSLSERIKMDFLETGLLNYGTTAIGDHRKWYWLAPLLLDKQFSDTKLLESWVSSSLPDDSAIDAENNVQDKDEGKGKILHRKYVATILQGTLNVEVGIPNEEQLGELCLYLADLCLGSPAVCLLRSFLNHFDLSDDLLHSVYTVASGFITLFNKPESIAILRLTTESKEYYRSVVEYSVSGNLQAVLDEYIYLLNHCENFVKLTDLSNHFTDLLSLRSSGVEVDDLKTFVASTKETEGTHEKRKTLRTHYAMDFGNQKLTSAGSNRLINMRQAFNSPFRPFVLATTSIGQEGLDFHLYCKKIFHWNLPSNPIDFEQREGRIHRYKGHVIRLNLAHKYGANVQLKDGKSLWECIFDDACGEKQHAKVPCDLIPFWHTDYGDAPIHIERYVPVYPFSKDIEKLKELVKILTYYRLTFGQPRQEDLVESLHRLGYDSEEIKKLNELMIDLSPLRFY